MYGHEDNRMTTKSSRLELRLTPDFAHKLNYLAQVYSEGNRSELIRDVLERLYQDTKAEEAEERFYSEV